MLADKPGPHSHRIPDFVKLAEALGVGVGVAGEDVVGVINQARTLMVIDFIVGCRRAVWPMVAAGTSNDGSGRRIRCSTTSPKATPDEPERTRCRCW